MVSKRCETCPANAEYWKWRLSWTGDTKCIMEECRQLDQVTCAFCPIHMKLRNEYKESTMCGKRPKPVRCIEDDIVFSSQTEAAKYYKTYQAAISKVVDDPRYSVRGKHFERWNCFKCAELHKVEG